MTTEQLNELLYSYEEKAAIELFECDYTLFSLLYSKYKDTPYADIPDTFFMFMELDGWQGMSLRCGVWQYYESGSYENGKLERVKTYLEAQGEKEMADIFSIGIHDYTAPEYGQNFGYPQKWLEEAENIDNWIYDNEEYIYNWKRRLVSSHKDEFLKLAEDKSSI